MTMSNDVTHQVLFNYLKFAFGFSDERTHLAAYSVELLVKSLDFNDDE